MQQSTKQIQSLAIVGIVASGCLSLMNLSIGWVGRSTSVTAAGVEFAGDVFASGVVLFGTLLAARPADEDHPYGHGRIEILAALLVGVILAFGGVAICLRSLQKVATLHQPPATYTLWPLAVAVIVKSFLATSKFSVGRRLGSAALVADAWNDAVDILSAMAAIGALLLTFSDPTRFLAADHYGGFAVGLVVVYTGIRVVRDASVELIDTMPPPHVLDDIRGEALAVEEVWAVEKLWARKTGLRYHVDLHLQMDPEMTVAASHEVAARVRRRIRDRLPSVADVLVHVEPGRRT
jgi:cation diffusion facilitator family transporter